jgi:hypothetical protein
MSVGPAHDGARPGPVSERRQGPQGPPAPAAPVLEQVSAATQMAEVSRRIARAATPTGPAAPPVGGASRTGLSPRQVLALQRSVGNRAVATIMRSVAQRVPIEPKRSETLYNTKDPTTGKATAGSFGGKSTYEMTRSGDAGVTISIRIKFLNQTRNSADPAAPGAAADTPPLGKLIGDPTEIPASDPRRAWATDIATGAVAHWNGHLTLVGEEWNLTEDNTKKRLPVTFQSTPVFGVAEPEDARVIVHPPSTLAGSPGQKIDAGNWYMNKGDYSGDDKVIAAHEYGHLLGIPDEYSQSNEQLNALIHQAAPGTAPSARAALDRTTVERMVLVALRQPMYNQLAATLPTVTDALRDKRKMVKKKMAAAAKAGVVTPEVRNELTTQLTAASGAKLGPSVPGVVAFETTANFSSITRADEGVEAGFSAAALSKQIRKAYWDAFLEAGGKTVAVAGLGDVSVNVQSSVPATTAAGGAQAASASGVAASTVGPAAAPGLPAIAPPASLTAKLTALPATWGTAGSALETGVTAAAFSTKMVAALRSTGAVAAAVAAILPTFLSPKMEKQRDLYARAYQLVTNAAADAARQVATELVAAVVDPVLTTSVSDLQASIATEVTRIMATPPSGVAALGTPDPNMVAMVAAMKARLDADKAATADTGRDPLAKEGATAAPQDVTYSYQGLMGSNKTTQLRADQFGPMVEQFNKRLSTTFEKKFTAEVK